MDEESNKLIETLLNESDRGLILAGAAFLDNTLKELLEGECRDGLSKADKDQLFTYLGPLSSLSSRTLVAYALELIDDETRKSLNLLREIRNHFAHHAGITPLPADKIDRLLNLADPSISLGVVAFGNSNDPKFSDERVKVSLCIVSLWAKIKHKTKEVKK